MNASANPVEADYRLKKKPELMGALERLLEADTAGDPMSGRKWTRKSLKYLSQRLQEQGHEVSPMTLRRLLLQQEYSLKANQKEVSESAPERDQQFRYIQRVRKLFTLRGHPVISVDAKKRELIGNFKNAGRQWSQTAEQVNVHDFPSEAIAKATPYGVYDVNNNLGYVYVGVSANTPEFAVNAIGRWWQRQDRPLFADESKLLILCDSGGSNSCRARNWKKQLQEEVANAFNVEVMVCHYPKGTSKWNPIEHRLFSFISLNWAGIPLRSLAIMLNLIRGTTTDTGLKVKATLIRRQFATQVEVSDQEMAALNIIRRKVNPRWNYIIKPQILSTQKV